MKSYSKVNLLTALFTITLIVIPIFLFASDTPINSRTATGTINDADSVPTHDASGNVGATRTVEELKEHILSGMDVDTVTNADNVEHAQTVTNATNVTQQVFGDDAAYYYPDNTEADQGVTAVGGNCITIYDVMQEVGTSGTTVIVLRKGTLDGETNYALDTSIDLSTYPNIFFIIQNGARLTRVTGDETITFYSPQNLIVSEDQTITTVSMVTFANGGTIYPALFGSISDTVDSAAVISMAISSLAQGSEILIPQKIAVGSGGWTGLSVDTNNITIRGINRNSGFKILSAPSQNLAGSGKVTAILIDGVTGFRMIGIEIDGNSIDCNLLGLDSCSDCLIENNYIHDSGTSTDANGIYTEGGNGNKYLGNHIYSNAGRGMWIGNTNSGDVELNAVISHNFVENNGHTGIGGTQQFTSISNNVSRGNGGSGITQGSSINGVCHDNAIIGNICENNSFHGIQPGDVTADGYNAYALTINGNICRHNDNAGIYIFGSEHSSITDNVLYDNNYNGSGTSAGIVLGSYAVGINVIGNVCYDTRSGANRTQTYGINIVNQPWSHTELVEKIILSSNICKNNLTYGIYINNQSSSYPIDDILVSSNLCVDNGNTGIQIADATAGDFTNFVVIGNICEGNTTYDIRIDDTVGALYPYNMATNINGMSTQHGYGYDTATGTYSITDPNTTTLIDSSGGAVTATLNDGTRYGQIKTIIMTDATASSTVSVTSHETSDPEVFTFADLDDTLVLMWTSTKWITIKNSGVGT